MINYVYSEVFALLYEIPVGKRFLKLFMIFKIMGILAIGFKQVMKMKHG